MEDKIISKDIKDIKTKLRILQEPLPTHIIAVAQALDYDLNHMLEIPCANGKHLNNAVYDLTKDCYVIPGVSYHILGMVPVSYSLMFDNIPGWDIDMALPEIVFKRYLTGEQKKEWEAWKDEYDKKDFFISYLQMIGID